MVWITTAAICLAAVTSVAARVCVLGTEPDDSAGGRVRFVLPPGDPCSCTQVMLGGHNAYAPPRKDQPVYIDTLPMNAEGLRRSQGCPNKNAQSEDPKKTSTSLDETLAIPVAGEVVYTDCQQALSYDQRTSGVYTIDKEGTFNVYCDMVENTKGYIVIQRRNDGSVNFNRSWADYEKGFGDLNGEFWLGNDKIHKLTFDGLPWELIVTLTAFDGTVAVARYSDFQIKELKDMYEIAIGFDGGDAGDGFDTKHFSAFDKDNDDDSKNCAKILGAGWWLSHCDESQSNLNGVYYTTPMSIGGINYKGIYWSTWKFETLKATEMKIRQITT
ncbi:fibrinogen-like protein 1 [Asterias amurensis]|uniref:fibrinogen-like protein 1 n=1 Tax=Asterias amurensis TaxID=7602 RepID=UPI003AB74D91